MAQLELTVNGVRRRAQAVRPHTTLLGWLRDQGLTGAKEGCAEGECGACAVLLARPSGDGGTRYEAVNSCLVLLGSLSGQEVVTAEGLGRLGALHPVQRELAMRGGSQCGYCTPGFVVSMAAEYYRPERLSLPEQPATPPSQTPTDHNAAQHSGPNGFDLHALSGNLCRCTGYRPIQDAAYALGQPEPDDALHRRLEQSPPLAQPVRLESPDGDFVRPGTLRETLELLAAHPDAKLLSGGTDWGVEVNLRHRRAKLTLAIGELPELNELRWTPDFVEIGAGLNLSEIERRLGGFNMGKAVPLLSQWYEHFASRLIRNSATLGGNLGTASPIGDSPPVLLALEARLVLSSLAGEREAALSDFSLGYRQTLLRPGELIRAVRLPLPLAPITAFYKIAKRRFDDISSVAVGIALELDGDRVRRAHIGLGGVAATPIRALATEAALEGQLWTERNVRAAAAVMGREGTPQNDGRASAAYRAAMLEQTLLKFYAEHALEAAQ